MQIHRLHDQITSLKREAQRQATERYNDLIGQIDAIKSDLVRVRQKVMPLLEVDDNNNRVTNRIEREHAPIGIAIERINGTVDFQDTWILDKLAALKKSVCRISTDDGAVGTGFLISNNIIITNHHVIPNVEASKVMRADFGYEVDEKKQLSKPISVKLNAKDFFCTSSIYSVSNDPTSGLDFTMVALDPQDLVNNTYAFTPCLLDGSIGKIVVGEQCVTIQHPDGGPKKIVFKDISLLKVTETHLIYESDTLPGSSGSMVVALGTGEVIALHHAGVPTRDSSGYILTTSGNKADALTPDNQISWDGNEGVRISCIMNALENMQLPPSMNAYRDEILKNTRRNLLSSRQPVNDSIQTSLDETSAQTQASEPQDVASTSIKKKDFMEASFIVIVKNRQDEIQAVNNFLGNRYGDVKLELLSPLSAVHDNNELFSFTAPISKHPEEEVVEILRFPYIIACELDSPLALNSELSFDIDASVNIGRFESSIKDEIWQDEFSNWNEPEFLKKWSQVFKDPKIEIERIRRWNQISTKHDFVKEEDINIVASEGITIVQMDTGFTDHSKISGGMNINEDFDALDNDEEARDVLKSGILKAPGHGTRTGSILIGRRNTLNEHDGNFGLLASENLKILPYRIANSVLLINRQKQLARAVDRAIASGAEVISLSMGTAPTVAIANMAKKVYDAGIVWCCAAGNYVKFVVAPAVYPGTIAVAATNPVNLPWQHSSEGDQVDICAPGEDVYVPILTRDDQGRILEDFAYGSGTSYATPHVAAAAALWLAKYRNELRDFRGWQRVEAFRKALRRTANKPDGLPNGFGPGILDFDKLLTSPKAKPGTSKKDGGIRVEDLQYAYDTWDENAFISAIYGWGELIKTYWNLAHKGFKRVLGVEAFRQNVQEYGASVFAIEQEKMLFPGTPRLEGLESISTQESIRRMNILHDLIFKAH